MMPAMVGGPRRDPIRVRAMFDEIAARYDLGNALMTLGLDARWRRRTARVAIAGRNGVRVLDCACGTGSLTAALVRAGALRVVGVDFSERMLEVARRRHPALEFLAADVLHLPFGDETFDAVTIGFGLRNLADPVAGLREMTRVLRPGGRLVVLEAVPAEGPLRPVLGIAARLGPALVGRALGRAPAYHYLSETVRSYATAAGVAGWLAEVGQAPVGVERLGLGAVALVWGERRLGAK
jgi:demethylmenaquinone methyltransferase / 2-methoxy-6-polyprenyl-1,4-benzoquinol methylase